MWKNKIVVFGRSNNLNILLKSLRIRRKLLSGAAWWLMKLLDYIFSKTIWVMLWPSMEKDIKIWSVLSMNINLMQESSLRNIRYQQDGAMSHTARGTIILLNRLFPQKLISRHGDVKWHPRSPDLTIPNFYLWGYFKGKVYINKQNTITWLLKRNIQEKIRKMNDNTLTKATENFEKRLQMCCRENECH